MKTKGIVLSAALISGSAFAVNVDHYGIVKGSLLLTDGLANNHKAFTAGADSKSTNQLSFKQSRWGMKFSNDSKVTAQVEFDFDGQDGNSNGPAAGVMRARLANMTYAVSKNGTLTAGKKWTKFMGVLPHTYSITQVNFKSGNTGFIVDGADYTHKMGKLSLAAELSNYSGDNSGTTGNTTVQGVSTPVMTVAVDYKADMYSVGFAHSMGELKYSELVDANKDEKASGTKVYGTFTGVKSLDVRAEYYTGVNLASLHTGGLVAATAGTTANEFKEKGYFLSAKYTMGKMGFFGSIGKAEFDDAKESGTGMFSNEMKRIGFDYKLEKDLTFFVEHKSYETKANEANEVALNGKVLDMGLIYKF